MLAAILLIPTFLALAALEVSDVAITDGIFN